MTVAFAEIRGRSYGGGVLELEPREAEGLPIARCNDAINLTEADAILRAKGLENCLAYVDGHTLEDLGLTSEIEILREIWRKLYHRRRARKKRVNKTAVN
jgi:hypothetical protein